MTGTDTAVIVGVLIPATRAATVISAPPQRICIADDQIACKPEPHSLLSEYAGVVTGDPATRLTRRAW